MFDKFKKAINSASEVFSDSQKEEGSTKKTSENWLSFGKDLIFGEATEITESSQKLEKNAVENTSESWLNIGKNFITNGITNANSSANKSLEKPEEATENVFDGIYDYGKNLVLGGIVEMDAKATAELISMATSLLPFVRVLEVTDRLKLTDRSAFTERMILNLQEMAQRELERIKIENSPQKLPQSDKLLIKNSSEIKLYSQELELLIELALIDGVLTEQEKQMLFKKAESEGINLEEFQAVLQGRLNK